MIDAKRDEQAFHRRLAILILLHRGPQTARQMRAALEAQDLLDLDYLDEPRGEARLVYQLRRDLVRLRRAGYEITYDKRSQCYRWHNSPFGLALNDQQLFALGIIRDTFAETTILHGAQIRDFLDYLVGLLPPEHQAVLTHRRRPYRVDLRETSDYRNADPRTVRDIERAIEDGQQLELTYRSSREGLERRHTVEPRPLTYRDGHVYLPVYNVVIHKEFDLRLDNIVPGSTRILPQRALPGHPPLPTYTLRYRLSPTIARHHVSDHFPGQQVEHHPDGSATITAEITNLFAAKQLILKYGEKAQVLSPPELIADLRTTITTLYHTYCTAEE